MSEEGFEDSFVPAGSQAGEEAGKEDGGESNGKGFRSRILPILNCHCKKKRQPLGDKGETTGEEDENEARGEESLLRLKNPARTHLQVLGKTQGRGDD